MATTTPNFGWPVPTSTDLVKDGATAMEALGDAIDTSMVDLKGGTTGQVLAKASNTDMDFSWVAQDDSNAIQNSIVDAKGDIIAATAADTPARLAVGANDLFLAADSAEASGLKYTGGWTSYTPTLTNITLGNGTVVANWQQIGKTVNVFFKLTFGSTTTISVFPSFSLPKNSVYTGYYTGKTSFQETGAVVFQGSVNMDDGTKCWIATNTVSGGAVRFDTPSATYPFTFGSTDVIISEVSYEVA